MYRVQALCNNKSLTDPAFNSLQILLDDLIKYKKRYGDFLTTELMMQVIRLEYISVESVIQMLVPLRFIGITVSNDLIPLMPRTCMLQSKTINACATLRHAEIPITNELLKYLFERPIISEVFVLLLLALQFAEVDLTKHRMHKVLMREISGSTFDINLYLTICDDEIEKKQSFLSKVAPDLSTIFSFPAELINIVFRYFIDTSEEPYAPTVNRMITTANHEFDTVKVEFDLDDKSKNSSFTLTRSSATNIKGMRKHSFKMDQSSGSFKKRLSKSIFFLHTIPSEHIKEPMQGDGCEKNESLKRHPKRNKKG